MTARRITLSERVDILALKIWALEEAVGFDRIEPALTKITGVRGYDSEPAPPKAPRRKKAAAR